MIRSGWFTAGPWESLGPNIPHRAEQFVDAADAVVAFPARIHGGGRAALPALQTDDIFQTAQLLKERGAQTLPIPANYYQDLQARFDLDSALIERLARQRHPV